MENMTYRQLANLIASLTEEQKDANVTILCRTQDEFFPVIGCDTQGHDYFEDVLDDNHPYLIIES